MKGGEKGSLKRRFTSAFICAQRKVVVERFSVKDVDLWPFLRGRSNSRPESVVKRAYGKICLSCRASFYFLLSNRAALLPSSASPGVHFPLTVPFTSKLETEVATTVESFRLSACDIGFHTCANKSRSSEFGESLKLQNQVENHSKTRIMKGSYKLTWFIVVCIMLHKQAKMLKGRIQTGIALIHLPWNILHICRCSSTFVKKPLVNCMT